MNEGGEENGFKVYISGLQWRAGDDEVQNYFGACVTIIRLELPLQDDGRSSGTVEFILSYWECNTKE